MNKIVLDTNCILSFLKNRNEGQFEKMGQLFERISNLQLEAFVIGHVISEVVFVLGSLYSADKKSIHKIITGLLENPGVSFESGYFPRRIFGLWPKSFKDYGDAVIAAAAYELGLEVATFDTSFHKELSKQNIKSYLL
ncbi:MAG: PIN domain-containing protein [Leptospira sp.]|nr:PIN domain-containing protein [Leptospira sp.]